MNVVRLSSVYDYNRLYGLPTKHPLVSVVNLAKAANAVNNIRMNTGLYALFIKNDINCRLKYGRQYYDFQAGTIVSFSPGQIIEIEMPQEVFRPEIYGLLFHPDLIYGMPLSSRIREYSFFEYNQNEALHLSDQERMSIIGCLDNIDKELDNGIDKYSRKLIVDHVELVLDYCMRFYDRQFCTREKANSDVLVKFEHYIDEYYAGYQAKDGRLPTVRYFADKVFLSPGYFGDMIKKETGKTAQEYIQDKIIGISKIHLSDKKMSISEISVRLGFQYPQHFIRLFKKVTGCTPGEFRDTV